MASVRNSTDPLPQTASNTALFHMMLHYKTESETAKAESAALRDRMASMQEEIHNLHLSIRAHAEANRRGAELIHNKHEAGVMLLGCTDNLATLLGTMRREVPEVAAYCPEIERILMRADFAAHMLHGVNMNFEADEVIDLTGEETEEETEDVEL